MSAHAQKIWWGLAIRGLIGVLIGILALLMPGFILDLLIYCFAFLVITAGVVLLVEAFSVKDDGEQRLKMFEGLLCIIAGMITLFAPQITITILMIIISVWAIVIGIFQITGAIKIRKHITNEWIGIMNGLITLVFGILILLDLIAGANAIVMLFGIFALITGIFSIVLSFKIKNHNFKQLNIGALNE